MLSTVMSSSRLGPQLRDWQNSGVPTKNAVGLRLEIASFSVIWCMSQGGLRVQIGLTPSLLATVGVTLGIAVSPGILVSACPLAFTWMYVVPMSRDWVVVSAMRVQNPGLEKLTCTALRPWGSGGGPSGWA